MATEVKTIFVVDDRAANAKIDAYEKRLNDIAGKEKSFTSGGGSFNRAF